MNETQLREAVSKGVNDAIEKQKVKCYIGLDRNTHEDEHRFLRKLIEISDRIDNWKWSFAGTLGRLLGIAMITWAGWGFVEWLKLKIGK